MSHQVEINERFLAKLKENTKKKLNHEQGIHSHDLVFLVVKTLEFPLADTFLHVCIEFLASAFPSHPLNAYANWNEYKAQPCAKKKMDATKPQNVICIQQLI